LQYAKENIRINSVHPGYADTPLTMTRFSDPAVRQGLLDRTPMGRLGTAEDIANGVLFPGVRRIILGHRLGTGDRWRHDGAVSTDRSTARPRRWSWPSTGPNRKIGGVCSD
jgi:NAD(P)-dependent dehydrogenase (short-subunit alcohol dehydrogenase family)